jgi:integrase
MSRSRPAAPTYLTRDRARDGWYLRFKYTDSAGRVHWPRERSPAPQQLRASVAWAAARRLEIIRDIEADVRRRDERAAAAVTLGQVMDAYELDARERGTRWQGSEAYRAAVILATLGRSTPAAALTQARVLEWRREVRARRASAPLANRSLNAYTSLLQAALNHAAALGMIPANPLAGLKRLPETQREPPALTERQVAALFAALPAWKRLYDSRDKRRRPRVDLTTRVYLGYYTGGRPEALDALRWSQLDLRRAILRYSSKGHDNIVVPLDPPLLARLKAVHAARRPAPGDLVMPSADGGGVVTDFRDQWSPLVRLANAALAPGDRIPAERSIHCLRHSRITHWLQAGVPPQAVAQLVGTSLAMLQRHYAHLMARSLTEELARARRHRALRAVDQAARPGRDGSQVGQTFGQTRKPKTAAARGVTRSGTGRKLSLVK